MRLGIEDLDLILKERSLRWYGHVEWTSGAVKTAFDIQIDGKHGPGRPKMTWKQLTERDCRVLSAINPHDRRTWRSGVQQASYLESGPLIWMLTFFYITKENKTQTLFSVSFILLHFIAYMT